MSYTAFHYNFILILMIFAINKLKKRDALSINLKEYRSFILALVVILYIGFRPLSTAFTDMIAYNTIFEGFANGTMEDGFRGDVLWSEFMRYTSSFMSAPFFFLTCSILYVFPLYVASKKWVGANAYFLLLMAIGSFSFWAYGVNGIRNGIATSMFILGLSFSRNKKILKLLLFLIAFMIHQSVIIPLAAYVITVFVKNPKYFLLFWLASIPLSLVLGSISELFFASLGFGGERVNYLIQGNVNNDSFRYTGFRWDFLLYSASGVFSGYYFIIVKKFKDPIYIKLVSIFLISNSFWILIIRANFSNRFAYLSWFLIAFVIFYPFLKSVFLKKQNKLLSIYMLAYFAFTYFMFLIT